MPLVVLATLLGLLCGSFAAVAAYRIPRREQLVSGRSRCPRCRRVITASENIPLVSYLWQRGRCRGCGSPISLLYPLTELATGVLFGLAAARFGPSVEAVVYAAFFWVLVVLTAIDLEHRLLPDRVVYPAFFLGWAGLTAAAVIDGDPGRLVGAAVGALIFGGFFFFVATVVPAGLGGGDVKLAFVLGSFLGYLSAPGLVLVGMFLSFLLGSAIGLVAMLATGGSRKMKVPFGPFLAAGTVLAILAGPYLLDAYFGLL